MKFIIISPFPPLRGGIAKETEVINTLDSKYNQRSKMFRLSLFINYDQNKYIRKKNNRNMLW